MRLGLLTLIALLTGVALVPAQSSAAYSDEVLADNPHSYFRMDDGNLTMDNVTAAPNGSHVQTATGPTLGIGGALTAETPNHSVGYLNDETDHSTFLVNDTLATYDAFTIEFFVFSPDPNPVPGATQWHSGKGLVDGDINNPANDAGVAIIQNGLVGFGMGNPDVTIASATAVDDAVWHHVVATSDGAGFMRLFVDGVQEGSFASAPTADRTNTGFSVGHLNFPSSGNGELAGALDEVAFYRHDLTQSRVVAHYNASLAPVDPPLDPPPLTSAPPSSDPCRGVQCMSPADQQKLADFFASLGKAVNKSVGEAIRENVAAKPVTVQGTSPFAGTFKWDFNFCKGTGLCAQPSAGKALDLGGATIPVTPGPFSTTLTLSKAGVKKLRKAGKANLSLTQSFTDTAGGRIDSNTNSKLKVKRKKK